MTLPQNTSRAPLPRPPITQIHLTLHVPTSLPMDLVVRAVNGLAAVLLADVKGRFIENGHAHFDLTPREEMRP